MFIFHIHLNYHRYNAYIWFSRPFRRISQGRRKDSWEFKNKTVLKAKTRIKSRCNCCCHICWRRRCCKWKNPSAKNASFFPEIRWPRTRIIWFRELWNRGRSKRLSACFYGRFVEVCSQDLLAWPWTMCFRCVIYYEMCYCLMKCSNQTNKFKRKFFETFIWTKQPTAIVELKLLMCQIRQ